MPIRVWDLPTRLFHWLLVMVVTLTFITGQVGGGAMVWHMRCGLALFALLAFRLAWGLVGGRWSRFASFIYAPAALLRFLRGRPRADDQFGVGHDPLSGLSVFVLLGVLLAQVATGLVADDEVATIGPLNRFVAGTTGVKAGGWHTGVGQWLLVGLVVLHLGAILYHWAALRVDLVTPMLQGDKALPVATPASADGLRQRLLALVLGMACVGLAVWIWRLGG